MLIAEIIIFVLFIIIPLIINLMTNFEHTEIILGIISITISFLSVIFLAIYVMVTARTFKEMRLQSKLTSDSVKLTSEQVRLANEQLKLTNRQFDASLHVEWLFVNDIDDEIVSLIKPPKINYDYLDRILSRKIYDLLKSLPDVKIEEYDDVIKPFDGRTRGFRYLALLLTNNGNTHIDSVSLKIPFYIALQKQIFGKYNISPDSFGEDFKVVSSNKDDNYVRFGKIFQILYHNIIEKNGGNVIIPFIAMTYFTMWQMPPIYGEYTDVTSKKYIFREPGRGQFGGQGIEGLKSDKT